MPSPLSSETFIPSSAFPDPVHTMCVVGRNLWICTGGNTNAGTVVIYDLDTKAIKTKVKGWEEGGEGGGRRAPGRRGRRGGRGGGTHH